MKLAAIAWRNIFRNSRRSLLSGTAIAVAALVIVLMFAFMEGMLDDLTGNIFDYVTGHLRVRQAEYDEYEDLNPLHLRIEDYRRVMGELEGLPEVSAVAPRIPFGVSIYEDEQTYLGLGIGVDFQREQAFMDPQRSLVAGRLPRPGERELLLTSGLAGEVGVGAGERITLLGKSMYLGMSGMTFTVSGIVHLPVAAFNQSYLLVPLESAQEFLKMDGSVTELVVKARDLSRLEGTVERARERLAGGGLAVRSWKEIGSWWSIVRMSDISYSLMALFFFLLGTTVIINTTMMVVYERTREIGTVAALGMTGGEIVRLFFLEAFFIGAVASLAGTGLGVALTLPLAAGGINLGAMMEGMDFEISQVIYPRLVFSSTVAVFLYSTAVASLASLLPSLKAARVRPVEALRAV